MLFSAFTPLDLYRLSGETPRAQLHYEAMTANLGGAFDMSEGTRQEAFCYASSLQIARVEQRMREAARQNFETDVCEMMPVREAEYGLLPGVTATMTERRAAFGRVKRLHGVWTRTEIEAALIEVLGDDFIAYRPTPLADVVRVPADLGDAPQNMAAANVARKIFRITQAVSIGLGAPQTVSYELVDTPSGSLGAAATGLLVGDVLVVEPNINGIDESVAVTAVLTSPDRFTATFENPHTNDCLAFTHPYPRWISTKRHSLVIVTPSAAIDPSKRRLVDREMRRMVRASSTWDIVQSADGLVTGAFTIGSPAIGMQTIGSVTI